MSDSNNENEGGGVSARMEDPQVAMRQKIKWLFMQYVERDLSNELGDIADYFSFIAERINADSLSIDVDSDLIRCFESVHLLLSDKLVLYPEPIQKQVAAISADHRLCDVLALLGSLSAKEISQLNGDKFRLARALVESLSLFPRRKPPYGSGSAPVISRPQFLRMKVAMNRIASVVKYASTIKMVDYDESALSFRRNYNPELIDKNKLMAFINLLRVEINQHPESVEKNTIIERLESVERELRKPKVRWGIVITGFFMLFGFLADLKTLNSETYAHAYKIVNTILETMHCDGRVNREGGKFLGDMRHEKNDHEDQPGDYRESAFPPKKNDEDEIVT